MPLAGICAGARGRPRPYRDPCNCAIILEAADDVVVIELGEEVQARVHQAHDRGGSQDAPRVSTRASSSRSTSSRLRVERLYRDPFLQRFLSWRLRTATSDS